MVITFRSCSLLILKHWAFQENHNDGETEFPAPESPGNRVPSNTGSNETECPVIECPVGPSAKCPKVVLVPNGQPVPRHPKINQKGWLQALTPVKWSLKRNFGLKQDFKWEWVRIGLLSLKKDYPILLNPLPNLTNNNLSCINHILHVQINLEFHKEWQMSVQEVQVLWVFKRT